MSWWNFLGGSGEGPAAIVDVGSSSVSAALVSVSWADKNSPAVNLSGLSRADTHVESEVDYDRFVAEITRAVSQAVAGLAKPDAPPASRFICFLSSPFVISQTKIINYRDGGPLVFTPKILENLSRREADNFREKAEAYEKENGFGPDGSEKAFSVIENKIMSVKLDGYEMSDPFGKTAREATIAQFLSGSSGFLLGKIREAIQSATHCRNIEFHSYAFAAFSSLRDYLGHNKSFLAVDVSGELTDAIVSAEGVLTENISFPFGLNAIVREMALSQRTIFAEAASQLNLYLAGKLEPAAQARLETALEPLRQKWTDAFAETLSAILENSLLPEHLILTGDTRGCAIFQDWIARGGFGRFTLSGRPFRVTFLDYSVFAPLRNVFKTVRDTYLLLEALFYEKTLAADLKK